MRERVRAKLGRGTGRVRRELRDSFDEDHSDHQIAGSFALGAFITMLPTWGLGLLVFVVLIYLTDRINRIAMFASVIVFNPVIKWGVYGASMALGILLMGAVDEGSPGATAHAIVLRLLVGNLILAVVATVLSYLAVYVLVTRYRRKAAGFAEHVAAEI